MISVNRLVLGFMTLLLASCGPCREDLIQSIPISSSGDVKLLIQRRDCGATTGFVYVGRVSSLDSFDPGGDPAFEVECHEFQRVSTVAGSHVVVVFAKCLLPQTLRVNHGGTTVEVTTLK